MSAAGWRSWLVVAALLAWLFFGLGASWITFAANAAKPQSWAFFGVPIAGTVLPLVGLAMMRPIALPIECPMDRAGSRVFPRSRWRLLYYSVVAMLGWGFMAVVVPLPLPLLVTAAHDGWANRDAVSGIAALAIGLLILILVPVTAAAQWMMMRPAWARRRWPFAVVGPERLWIDGQTFDWQSILQVQRQQANNRVTLLLQTRDQQVALPLFTLAGDGKALHDAIAEQIQKDRPR